MAEVKKTGVDTHRATARGQIRTPDGGSLLIEPGEMVPPDQPIALADDDDVPNGWMESVKKGDRALAGAMDEALDPLKKDVDLTQLTVPALQAMAAERGVNVQGLNKSDLITAIKGADDPAR